MPLLAVLALLAGAPWADVSHALNVTVSPWPRTEHLAGDNVTLFCHVSQKRRRETLLAVRWVFALPSTQEHLMVKMTKFGAVQYYGNYTSRFYKRRLHLLQEKHDRTTYTFLILDIQQAEQGLYTCKVQEIGRQRNRWTSWSNGSASTEVQVSASRFLDEEKHNAWAFFEGKRNLVKSPQKSLQEAGGASRASGSPGPPTQRKGAKGSEAPPAVPAKAPIVSQRPPRPKLLRPHRKLTLLKGREEESLAYAELELLKPRPEAPGPPSATVYAQILFQENRV
ncbi:V-set and transmembrane domain-containing protein 4 isoform X3 [Erythrolamprus reginae]|uniref:V-set and transmembrane domain-containing protein 4 isoform X3 n=1 Tax=Erythrolamprus reginae TaxID=121349 RepID=UPI00396CA604